jgi:hypothetical protein
LTGQLGYVKLALIIFFHCHFRSLLNLSFSQSSAKIQRNFSLGKGIIGSLVVNFIQLRCAGIIWVLFPYTEKDGHTHHEEILDRCWTIAICFPGHISAG